jgi:hypothetical protein
LLHYAHVDNGKLDPRDVKCVFLGYGSGVKAFNLWNPQTKRILMRMNVLFNGTVIFTDSQTFADSDASDVSDNKQQRASMQVEHVDEKRITLLKMMILIMNLSLMIMIIILFHPHHLFRSNKVILVQLTVQGEPLLPESV